MEEMRKRYERPRIERVRVVMEEATLANCKSTNVNSGAFAGAGECGGVCQTIGG